MNTQCTGTAKIPIQVCTSKNLLDTILKTPQRNMIIKYHKHEETRLFFMTGNKPSKQNNK